MERCSISSGVCDAVAAGSDAMDMSGPISAGGAPSVNVKSSSPENRSSGSGALHQHTALSASSLLSEVD